MEPPPPPEFFIANPVGVFWTMAKERGLRGSSNCRRGRRKQSLLTPVQGRQETRLGSDVLVMANAHIAHDCVIGDRVTLANASLLAGHVTLQDDVITGGLACFHQHVTVGRGAFIAAGAMVERDVPPYCRAAGDRAALVGLNLIGLQRSGLDPKALVRLRAAYLALFRTDAPLTSQRAQSQVSNSTGINITQCAGMSQQMIRDMARRFASRIYRQLEQNHYA